MLLASGLVKLDVGGADDLRCELLERNSPLLDLGLESSVLLSLVGEVDRATVVLEDFAFGVVCNIDVA